MTAEAPVSLDLAATPEPPQPAVEASSLGAFRNIRFRPRWWWLAPLAAIPLTLGLGVRYLGPAESVAPAAPLPVEAIALKAVNSYTVERQYVGEIVAQRTSSLGFEQGGTVVALLVDEGDLVTTGQSLARLDTRSLTTQRQQLVAQRDQAIATLTELQNGP
ncbi:MAG: biotin/lipoyl-binding protein, partial [Leptolyngbyaceae cyanobacterium SM2_5_2]|nr:biotin/lipoyl-binding protein [Leptolyngbyaceae cyanobacterium SM2_5_2]